MVTEWLKRKADQQRQAARDFLHKQKAAPASHVAPALQGQPQQPQAQAEARAAVVRAAGGVVRQKVYNSRPLASAEQPTSTEHRQPSVCTAIPMQTAAGGVLRGKVYNASAK
jgi:hypothetical protein